ncbi:MAG TPA: NAD(P)-dependent oxidoreductase [Pilimelia sp.]|nr:NAD(P)-dependent oxidoreductase [Pilimelia sp.]
MRVVYTDPAWALAADGRPDPALAAAEREVFGPGIQLDLGLFDGRYVTSGDDFHGYVRGADALVIYRCQVTAELIDVLRPTCKVVARAGVGLDNLNAAALAGAGLYGYHVPDYCGDEVSTHTLALLLALERGICVQDRLVKSDKWAIHGGGVPRRTADRVAGIVGFGRIGRATARKLHAFYDRVLAYDPFVSADLMASHGVRRVEDLKDLFAEVDAVVLHTELTPDTDGLIDAAVLANAKPGCLLVNTARGRLVDPAAVEHALEGGRLGGFASDVFSPEDPNTADAGRRLLDRDDVVVSAHRAFLSQESERSARLRIAHVVRDVLVAGVPPAAGRVA